jgi:hypothetical protein
MDAAGVRPHIGAAGLFGCRMGGPEPVGFLGAACPGHGGRAGFPLRVLARGIFE